MNSLNVYIGWDSRETKAYEVCVKSILKHTSKNINIYPLKLQELRNLNYYTRPDDSLSSTEFTFSRFLVPYLNSYKGKALFCDCDFLFLDDINKIFDLADETKAVQCCKHDYRPTSEFKMEGAKQHVYPRKNWSSLVLFNCDNPSNKFLNIGNINELSGQYLHRFNWLLDDEIGSIPIEWNWLVNWYKEPKDGKPKALHFTEGGPWHKGYENCEYSELWNSYA
jgi:lipopolysaccharide biosynthesis glycosyltransferase